MHLTPYTLSWSGIFGLTIHPLGLTYPGLNADTTIPLLATLLCRAAPIKSYIMHTNTYVQPFKPQSISLIKILARQRNYTVSV